MSQQSLDFCEVFMLRQSILTSRQSLAKARSFYVAIEFGFR